MKIALRAAFALAFAVPILSSAILSLYFYKGEFAAAGLVGAGVLLVSLPAAIWLFHAVSNLSHSAKRDISDITAALDAHSIVAITDPAGRITYVNDKFCEISKFSREELLGQDHRIINSGTHPKEFFRELWSTIGAGKVWKGEIRNRAKDGSFYWVDTTIFPFLNEKGRPRQYVAIRTDITQRKLDEIQLSRFAKELAEKNKELETIVYVVSHDLRAPLLNVQGFGAALSRACEELDPAVTNGNAEVIERVMKTDIPRALRFIKAGISKMDALLAGFLKFSRAGRMLLSIQEVDVEKVIAGTIQAMKYQLEKVDADVKIGPVPSCLGDPALLGQVFSNLLDNAVKYRDPARQCVISISGRVEGDLAVYEIQDNGIGIPPAQQEKVFELFHRLDPKGSDGEGLGLTISQRMIERQQGRIGMASEIGKGTTFHISLPVAGR